MLPAPATQTSQGLPGANVSWMLMHHIESALSNAGARSGPISLEAAQIDEAAKAHPDQCDDIWLGNDNRGVVRDVQTPPVPGQFDPEATAEGRVAKIASHQIKYSAYIKTRLENNPARRLQERPQVVLGRIKVRRESGR